MRVASSSFVLAAMALSPVLGAPTPTIPPFDSPIPNSPRLDDWAESLRSPRIPRSPMIPAVRVAGRRRSIPYFRRQEEGAPPAQDTDTVSANGLLGGLGDTFSSILHGVGDVASDLPIVGGLGILSTDRLSNPLPKKRDEDADTASAEGLLGGLGDTLSGVLHQIGDVANGLPIVGGIGLLSADGSSPPQKRDDGDADTASAEGLLGGLGDTQSGILHQVGDVSNGLPIIGGLGILSADGTDPNAPPPQKRDGLPLSADQINALRQQVAALLLQQQQADQVVATLSAASVGLPVNPNDLQQRLLALQSTPQGTSGGLNLQGLLGGLPVAGPIVSNTVASAGGLAGGLPILGGFLGGNGLLGGVLGNSQGPLSSLAGAATGIVGGVVGTAGGVLGGAIGGDNGILQNVLGGGSPTSQAFTSLNQVPWPDTTGFYPHGVVEGTPRAPPNSPASAPSPIVYSPFSMEGTNFTPLVPPPSPASSVSSVPMDHDAASHFFASATSMTNFIPAPSSVPPSVLNNVLGRRRVDDNTNEGGPDAVPEPQDESSGMKTSPNKMKMFRRLIRGASVSL